jgi:hypothetical protein
VLDDGSVTSRSQVVAEGGSFTVLHCAVQEGKDLLTLRTAPVAF